MGALFQKLKTNRFFRSLLTLSGGTLVAQAVAILVSPFLTRVFSTYDLALFAFALAIINTFQASINGGYNHGIVVEGEQEEVFSLLKLSTVAAILLSALVGIGTFVYISFFSKEGYPALMIAVFVFLTLLSFGLIQTLTAYNNRLGHYKTIAAVGVYRSLSQNLGSLALGLMKLGSFGLLFSYLAGNLAGVRRQAKDIREDLPRVFAVPRAQMLDTAKRNRRYPLFTAPSSFVNSFSYSSVTLFIEALFDFNLLAYYSMSMRILGLPLALVSANVGRIFFADASKEFRAAGHFKRTFNKMALFLSAAALPMGLVMFLFAPPLSRWAFGPGWEVAGQYIRILTPMFCVRFIATAVSSGYLVAGRQRLDALYQVLLLGASVLSFLAAMAFKLEIEGFLLAISLSKTLIYTAYLLQLSRYSKGAATDGTREEN